MSIVRLDLGFFKPGIGEPRFQSLVITVDWRGVLFTATLGNGLLSKGWLDTESDGWKV